MNSPAHDIALYLQSVGLGDFGSNLFVGSEPATPDEVTTIYDYPGDTDDTDELDEQPRFQVRTRGSYEAAYRQQSAIKEALTLPTTGITAATSVFSLIVSINSIASLGRDGNQRYLMVASYRARRTNKET